MLLPMMHRLKSLAVLCVGLFVILLAGCSLPLTTVQSPGTETPLPDVTATIQCVEELILPQVTEIQPSPAKPGSQITVIGSGGYVRDSCGGFLEGLRTFELYLDNESSGEISCYVNHCEVKMTLPADLSTGSHCLSVELDKCQLEFQVTDE